MKRYADCFFRYWYIALLPVIALPVISLGMTKLGNQQVVVSANVWASPSALRALGYDDPSLSPAQNLVNSFAQVRSLTSFDRLVAKRSPLYAQLAARQANPHGWPVSDLQANLKPTAIGTNLVTITYSGENAAVGTQVLRTVLQLAPPEMQTLNHTPVTAGVLQVADAPAPAVSASSKKKQLLDLAIVFAVGLLIGGTFIVVKTALDRSVRYADEVPELVGLPVLGVVPYSRELGKQQKVGQG